MNYKYFLASFLFVFLSFNAVKAQAVISEKQAERALKKEQRQLKRIDRQYSDSIAYKAEYYQYMLLEDLDTGNFENLGWWQYQYNYYNSIIESAPENLTGKALIVDRFARNVMVLMVSILKRVYEIEANRPAAIRDIPAVVFLLMHRTIVPPKE